MSELILTGNGPGELSGWIAPVARAARNIDPALRLTLALSPSQFATGREAVVVAAWGLFDRLLDPGTGVRLAMGAGRLTVDRPCVLIHLGGELWLSGRLAQRLGVPACALAETTLVARRHRGFARIFATSATVAADLQARGVPAEKITVTGDPRADAVLARARGGADGGTPPRTPALRLAQDEREQRIISFMPGSRSRVFQALAPFFVQVAARLTAARSDLDVQMIVSEFLPPELVTAAQIEARRRWPDLRLAWITTKAWEAVGRSDFVVTIPGTSTAELATAAIPFGVVVPLDLLILASLEGPLEWIGRIPGVAGPLKRLALAHYLRSRRFIALPNQWARMAVVPEWIGWQTPDDVAERTGEFLDDPVRLGGIAAALRELVPVTSGAAEAIAREALALAGKAPHHSTGPVLSQPKGSGRTARRPPSGQAEGRS